MSMIYCRKFTVVGLTPAELVEAGFAKLSRRKPWVGNSRLLFGRRTQRICQAFAGGVLVQVYAVLDDWSALRRDRGRRCLPDPRPRFGDSDGDGAPHGSVHRGKHDRSALCKQGVFCQEFANLPQARFKFGAISL